MILVLKKRVSEHYGLGRSQSELDFVDVYINDDMPLYIDPYVFKVRPDSIYIKLIINKINPNATWYFTTHESKSKEALRIKKVKLRKYGFKGTFDIFNS